MTLSRFVIQPHVRLQEWVAEELGFFKDEGLDYEFQPDGFSARSLVTSSVQSTDEISTVESGAFEDMSEQRGDLVGQTDANSVAFDLRDEHRRAPGRLRNTQPRSGNWALPTQKSVAEVHVSRTQAPTRNLVQAERAS